MDSAKDNTTLIIEDTSGKIDLMRLYFNILGEGKFKQALDCFKRKKGFGIDPVSCTFADEYEFWEEGYFGETGVKFSLHLPMTEVEEVAIVEYSLFFKYLKDTSENYLATQPQARGTIEIYMEEIKENLFNND